MNKYLNRINI